MNKQPPILCLMGPTATGKTDLAIELAQHFPIEIISVDSAMVYRDMDIGTAKPTADELTKAPHQLINLCDPSEPYSAGRFRKDALEAIEAILQRGNLPLLVGGTMLYFHVLQNGVASLPTADETIRESLSKEAEQITWAGMHEKLKLIDPKMAEQLHPNDAQRIQRALEIFEITGQTMTVLQNTQSAERSPYRFINIVLESEERKRLHDRIEQRFTLMLERGFLEEVERLKTRPDLHKGLPSIRTVGYRQAWAYLNAECDKATMQERAVIATRQLAKRQLTWLRRWEKSSRYSYEKINLYQRVSEHLQKEIALEHFN